MLLQLTLETDALDAEFLHRFIRTVLRSCDGKDQLRSIPLAGKNGEVERSKS